MSPQLRGKSIRPSSEIDGMELRSGRKLGMSTTPSSSSSSPKIGAIELRSGKKLTPSIGGDNKKPKISHKKPKISHKDEDGICSYCGRIESENAKEGFHLCARKLCARPGMDEFYLRQGPWFISFNLYTGEVDEESIIDSGPRFTRDEIMW